MTRRALTAIVAVALIALALFGVPLALAIRNLTITNNVQQLEQSATRAATAVSPDAIARHDPLEFANRVAGTRITVYNQAGARVSGDGPTRLQPEFAGALRGNLVIRRSAALTVAVPVVAQEHVIGALTVSRPRAGVDAEVRRDWLLVLALGLGVLAVSSGLAWFEARRLARPLRRLAEAATRAGEVTIEAPEPASGIAEVDEVAHALASTSGRLHDALARERAFSADASHQLRTPLTGLRITVERAQLDPNAAPRLLAEALSAIDRIDHTIDDLLALARDTHGERAPVDVGAVLRAAEDRWHGALAAEGRPLRVTHGPALPEVTASPIALAHILDVLLDNARRHGQGAVSVHARRSSDALTIEVTDEGPGIPADAPEIFVRRTTPGGRDHIGLSLARSLAEAEGARLTLIRRAPHPVFALVLPSSLIGLSRDDR